MPDKSPQSLRELLEQACASVKQWETQGQEALAAKNTDSYRNCMLEKAKLLASLDRQSEAFISSLPAAKQAPVANRLRAFSASATKAIALNSVFYMSALLYPDDYVQGNPNDLRVFTEELFK